MDLITVKGTFHEMGAQHGEALRDAIRAVYAELVEPQVKDVAEDVVQAAMKPFYDKDAARIPWVFEEMRGIADGSGIPYRDILLMNYRAFGMIGWYRDTSTKYRAAPGCTAMGMVTEDAGVAVGGNADGDSPSYYRLIRRIARKGIPHMQVNWVGTVWGHNGANAEGLGLGSAGSVGWYDTYDVLQDATVIFNDMGRRHVLQHGRTVTEALAFLHKNPVTCQIALGDSTGALVCIQGLGAFGMAVMDARNSKGLVYSPNHVFYPEAVAALRKRGIEPEVTPLNGGRQQVLDRAREIAPRTLAGFKALLRSRENEPLCICDGTHHQFGLWPTYWSTYVLPQKDPGVLYFSEYPIRENEYAPIPVEG